MKYPERIHIRLSENDKKIIQSLDIPPRVIIERFIKEYCSTKPKGLIIKKEQLESKILGKKEQINRLYDDINRLEMKIKTIDDRLNKTLDAYIDEDLNNAVKSISTICKERNFKTFEEIPEQIFINIAKHHKIEQKTLKKEVSQNLFKK
jgi:chromosome segregation ATPase